MKFLKNLFSKLSKKNNDNNSVISSKGQNVDNSSKNRGIFKDENSDLVLLHATEFVNQQQEELSKKQQKNIVPKLGSSSSLPINPFTGI